MTELTRSDLDDLRLSADRLKLLGRFDSGVRLHTLLDAYEKREDSTEAVEDLESKAAGLAEDIDSLKSTMREIAEMTAPSRKGALTVGMTEAQLVDEVESLREKLRNIHVEAKAALR